MALYPDHNLSRLALKGVKAPVSMNELGEWNRDLLMWWNLLIVNDLVAVKRSSVEVKRDSRPSEVVKVGDNDCGACKRSLRFSLLACQATTNSVAIPR